MNEYTSWLINLLFNDYNDDNGGGDGDSDSFL